MSWGLDEDQCHVHVASQGNGWPANIIVKVSCLPFYKRAYIKRQLWTIAGNILESVWSGEVLRNWFNYPCDAERSQNDLNLEQSVFRLAQMCKTDHLFPEVRTIYLSDLAPDLACRTQ